MVPIPARAWALLLERIEQKTSWGKEELKVLMLRCIIDVMADRGDAEPLS